MIVLSDITAGRPLSRVRLRAEIDQLHRQWIAMTAATGVIVTAWLTTSNQLLTFGSLILGIIAWLYRQGIEINRFRWQLEALSKQVDSMRGLPAAVDAHSETLRRLQAVPEDLAAIKEAVGTIKRIIERE